MIGLAGYKYIWLTKTVRVDFRGRTIRPVYRVACAESAQCLVSVMRLTDSIIGVFYGQKWTVCQIMTCNVLPKDMALRER
jgi:hypothetical protein